MKKLTLFILLGLSSIGFSQDTIATEQNVLDIMYNLSLQGSKEGALQYMSEMFSERSEVDGDNTVFPDVGLTIGTDVIMYNIDNKEDYDLMVGELNDRSHITDKRTAKKGIDIVEYGYLYVIYNQKNKYYWMSCGYIPKQ